MRILIAHNQYQQPGGEDIVVAHEHGLLHRAGHKVELCLVSNQAIGGLGPKLRAAWQVNYSPSRRDWMAERIAAFRPDIVQVHNFFPLLTPSIYDACAQARVPVVQTLHNYRVACAAATFLRDGAVCEKCVGSTPYWAAVYRCYRRSLPGSLALAHLIDTHRRRGTWRSKVQLFFALTEFARRKFIAAGLPAERITVKPNFAPAPAARAERERHGALFVGRLSPEKGVGSLIAAWRGVNYPLTVAGAGPLLESLVAGAPRNVSFVGRLDAQRVAAEMAHAAFLVVPSVWYESFPMAIAEAYAAGLPVLASRIGALAEIVEDHETGRLFAPDSPDDLARVVRSVIADPAVLARMGEAAARAYRERYSPDAVYRVMIQAYERLVVAARVERVDGAY